MSQGAINSTSGGFQCQRCGTPGLVIGVNGYCLTCWATVNSPPTMPVPREEQRIAALEKARDDQIAINTNILRQVVRFEQRVQALEQPKPTTECEDAAFAAGYVTAYRALCQIPPRSTEIRGAVREWVEGGRKTHLDEGQQAGTEQLDEGQ